MKKWVLPLRMNIFEVRFSCLYTSEFQHEMYAEASAGLVMQVQELSSVFETEIAYSYFSQFFCTCQQFKMAKHNEAIKIVMYSQQELFNSDFSHSIVSIKKLVWMVKSCGL